jgi:hypothetical protein
VTTVATGVDALDTMAIWHADVDGVAGMAVGAVNEGMVRLTCCETPPWKAIDGCASA